MQVERRLAPPALDEVLALLGRAGAANGHRPIDEQHHAELAAGRHDHLVALLARSGGGDHAGDGDHAGHAQLAAYGHLVRGQGEWSVEVVVDPGAGSGTGGPPGDVAGLARAVLGTAVDQVAGHGGGRLRYWAPLAGADRDAVAADLGFAPERDLLQLRVALPLPAAVPRALPAGVGLRAFRPGRDEAAWLEVNNRAFADHPEQGAWDLATLRDRESQPWFDPAGFVVAEAGGRLAGSCWTKVHRDTEPVLGEIYVISVDPDHHRHGLGRALAVAGLDHLAGEGVTVGMLYVDGGNDRAIALYRSLGFATDHVDRAYVREVAPVAPAGPAPGGQAPDTPTSRPMP